MGISRKSRREFLRNLCCVAAGGGVASMIPQLRMMSTALASSPLTGYKALVCLYLSGGNDSWNMVVPFDSTRFATYSTSKRNLCQWIEQRRFGFGITDWCAGRFAENHRRQRLKLCHQPILFAPESG